MKETGLRNGAHGADKFGLKNLAAVHWNLPDTILVEHAIVNREGELVQGGAFCAETGVHTGRSPKDKFVVADAQTEKSVWWEKNGRLSSEHFQRLFDAWKPLHDELDHHYLNDVVGLENPTSELLARWIWTRVKVALPELARVVVCETCEMRCEYEGT